MFRCSWDAVTRRHKPLLEPCDAFHTYGPAIHTSTTFFVTLWRITKEIAICISTGHCLNMLIHVRVRSSNSASLTSIKHQRIAVRNTHVLWQKGCSDEEGKFGKLPNTPSSVSVIFLFVEQVSFLFECVHDVLKKNDWKPMYNWLTQPYCEYWKNILRF